MFKKLIIVGIAIFCILFPLVGLEKNNFSLEERLSYNNQDIYLKPIPTIIISPTCSCVKFVQSFGVDVHGHAYQIKPNSDKPIEGGAVLFYGGKYGHIAVIYKVEHDSLIIIESNHIRCKITIRRIPIDYPLIKGFVK